MTDEEVRALAVEAATYWGGCAEPPRLVGQRENAVFEIILNDGQRAALRLHRPGYQSLDAIEGELRWTAALSSAGFACPEPVVDREGALVRQVGPRAVSVVSWIDAAPILEGDVAQREAVYARLGRCLGDLHRLTDSLAPGRLNRPAWDGEAFLGEAPLWGPFWHNSALSQAELDVLQHARDEARAQLAAINAPDMGLIHADALQENVLDDGERLWLIDFDDSGWGYRGYDLGTALVQHAFDPALPDLSAALLAGYAQVRPGFRAETLPLFMMLRGFASAGWIVPRAKTGDPGLRIYAERALRLAALFLRD